MVPFLGILSLDTRFARIAGDVGNPESYPFPARVTVVPGSDAARVVRDAPLDAGLVARFVDAARTLEAEGAGALVSTCGFLVQAQAEVARAVRRPVLLSALSMAPMLQAARPGRIGILTASAPALGTRALAAAGIDPDRAVIAGLDRHPLFAETFLAERDCQRAAFDREEMEALVLAEARGLLRRAPDLSALLLECGNLPPYAGTLRRETGLPVVTLLEGAAWMMAGIGQGGPARD